MTIFRAERDSLIDAFTAANRAVSPRYSPMPSLSGLLLKAKNGALTVTGSDIDMTVQAVAKIASDKDGSILVPAKLCGEIVKAMEPGVVTFDTTDTETCIVSNGRSTFDIRVLPVDEYPKIPEPFTNTVQVDAGALMTAIGRTVPAASHDDARPILTGVLCATEGTNLRLVATDSYRLAVADVAGLTMFNGEGKVLIPARSLEDVVKLFGKTDKITVGFDNDQTDNARNIMFASDERTMFSRLIEGEFPNYKGLIPASYPYTVTVPKAQFAEVTRRVALLAREATPVRLEMAPGALRLVAMMQDVGNSNEEIDVTYTGPEITIAFNPQYMLAGIESVPGDNVELKFLDALKPAVLCSAGVDDGYLYLLMPVRVS